MNHSQIESENVVERYLIGRLSAEQRARFEEHYLDCRQCLDQLELGRRLHRGLKLVAAEDGAHPRRGPVAAWGAGRGRFFQGALAAGLLTALILPWIVAFPGDGGPDPA
ncbi:MAG: hypothetical protein MI919_18735, partial [Holophagales bacterium]|nr:hypothetical protein [Holophagales bacterium]